ncbi:MAG: hypothetical protein AB7O97_11045 [Planctomycetota bacterium]
MSTSTQNPPVEPPKPEQPEHHDEFVGAFGFFRKYQKLILYTAGIFALITFSITGAMTQWLRGVTDGPTGPQPTIQVRGQTVSLELEDQQVAAALARNVRSLPPNTLPDPLLMGGTSDLVTRLAILRRAAIAVGLGTSNDEADAAIDWFVRFLNNANKGTDTATQIALQRGMNSLAEYRTLVKEALRIGNYVTLLSLGVDTSDAAAMALLLEGDDREKITCRVATFDMKALAEQLEQQGTVTEDDVRAWMEAKTEAEKSRLEVYDTNKVGLRIGAIRYDEFDPTQWSEVLDNLQIGDEQRRLVFKEEIHRWTDADGKQKAMDDPEVTPELDKLIQVDEVLNKLLGALMERQQNELKPLLEAYQQSLQQKMDWQRQKNEADAKLKADPENAELKDALRLAEETLTQMEANETRAKEALDAARTGFDFAAAWTELTKDRAGVRLLEVPGDNNAAALKDLSAVELGEWKMPELATSLREAGALGSRPARAANGAFLMQATHVIVRPMKPWDDIKENLQKRYYEEKAKEAGDAAKKTLADELLRLGKEQAPEKVAEIDQKRAGEIERRFAEWRADVEAQLANATQALEKIPAGTQARRSWEAKQAQLTAELEAAEKRKLALTEEVNKELDAEIEAEAEKHYAAVLDQAAATAGFALSTVGPYRRDLSSAQPFAGKRFERTIEFLWGGMVNALDAGEATDILEDGAEKRYQVAACTAVAPLTAADITRRDFAVVRNNFGAGRTQEAMQQSFELEALKERYRYEEPQGRLEER